MAATKKVYDLSVGVYMPYYMTEYLRGPLIDKITGLRDFLFFDGLGRLLTLAGYNFNMIDIERVSQAELNKTPYMCVFSLDFMDKATQMKLAEYVKKGGKLILNYQIPEKDLSLRSETYIRDWLGIKGITKSKSNLFYFEGKDCMTEGGISILESKNSEIIATTFDEDRPCAIKKKIGRGEALIAGFGLPHIFDYHIDITRKLCRKIGISEPKKFAASGLHYVKRTGDKADFDFIFNYHDEPGIASLNGPCSALARRSAMIIKNEK